MPHFLNKTKNNFSQNHSVRYPIIDHVFQSRFIASKNVYREFAKLIVLQGRSVLDLKKPFPRANSLYALFEAMDLQWDLDSVQCTRIEDFFIAVSYIRTVYCPQRPSCARAGQDSNRGTTYSRHALTT
jgi:hypothetical protein